MPCDGPQVEQVLINLIKNAVEATLEAANPEDDSPPAVDQAPPPSVKVTWKLTGKFVEFRVIDDGHGIGKATNLFVPFFTTKPSGSGIGLVLCRQIAENHDGELFLENRTDTRGCIAVLRLPA